MKCWPSGKVMRLAHQHSDQHSHALYPSYSRNVGSSLAARIKDLRLPSVPPSTSTLSNRSFIFVTSDSDSDSESDHSPSASCHPPSLPCIAPLSPISPISFFSFDSPVPSPPVPNSVPTSATGCSDSDCDSDDEFESDYDYDDEFASSCSSGADAGTDEEGEEEDFKVVFGFGVKRHDEHIGLCVGKEGGKGEYPIRRQRALPHSHRYRYQLVSALPMAHFTTGPCSMNAPWPYTFQKGAVALARTAQGSVDRQSTLWRRVTIIDNGHLSSFPLPSSPLPSVPFLSLPSSPMSFPQMASRSAPDLTSRTRSPSNLPPRLNASLLSAEHPTVTVRQPASPSPSPSLVYTAKWFDTSSRRTVQGTFCPTRGDLKPDDGHVRRLLAREGCRLIE